MKHERKDHTVSAFRGQRWVGYFNQDGSLVTSRIDSQPLTAADARALADVINADPQHQREGITARARKIRRRGAAAQSAPPPPFLPPQYRTVLLHCA